MQLGPRSASSANAGFSKQAPQASAPENQKQESEIPVIDIDDNEEIKAEDLPF